MFFIELYIKKKGQDCNQIIKKKFCSGLFSKNGGINLYFRYILYTKSNLFLKLN